MQRWEWTTFRPLIYNLGNSKIRLQRPLVIAAIIFVLIFLVYFWTAKTASSPDLTHNPNKLPPALEYDATYPLTRPVITAKGLKYRIGVISDLDTDSKVQEKSNLWRSYLKTGHLYFDKNKLTVDIEWDNGSPAELTSSLASGGRGMELSELIVFNGKLYSVDDRTGVIYQVMVDEKKVVPWLILADGSGAETKGFKSEWCTVKDNYLYVGGLGKEWTTSRGDILNHNPMFVKRISPTGQVEHLDWYDRYVKLRRIAGIDYPGYMIHESAAFSGSHRHWIFLPRRASKDKYNDVTDEEMGTNMLLKANEDFSDISLRRVGDSSQPSHGFSSFKFIPGSDDKVIVALKSEELRGKIASYIMVFRLDGEILFPETKIGEYKYEGIEFI